MYLASELDSDRPKCREQCISTYVTAQMRPGEFCQPLERLPLLRGLMDAQRDHRYELRLCAQL